MTSTDPSPEKSGAARDHTRALIDALAAGHAREHDFAGWLCCGLAELAARLGSSAAVCQGRPGSWEASFVDQLLWGTVGFNDEWLPGRAGEGEP